MGAERAAAFAARRAEIEAADAALRTVKLTAHAWRGAGVPIGAGGGWYTAAALLTRPAVGLVQGWERACTGTVLFCA